MIGENVFVSTLEKRTYAVRASDGKIVWRLPLGRYSPGIATERTYFFSLNGRLLAIRGRDVQRALRDRRVAAAPERRALRRGDCAFQAPSVRR